MRQKLAIFILLWISLTFNLECNEMYSYFLVFFFLLAHLAKGNQELPVAAMLANGSGQNEQSL
jgi:hypothetical protein